MTRFFRPSVRLSELTWGTMHLLQKLLHLYFVFGYLGIWVRGYLGIWVLGYFGYLAYFGYIGYFGQVF